MLSMGSEPSRVAQWLLFFVTVRLPVSIAIALLSLSGVARAAPQTPANVSQAQAALAHAEAEASRLSANRQAVQAELDKLGATIAEKKKSLPANAEPGVELIQLLQASTRLASQLDELQREVAAAADRAQQAADRLARSCDAELGGLQARWSQSPASERPALEGRIAEVGKSCSGRSLGQLDKPAGDRSIPASALAPVASDDAQALQQKADFLHDREDLLRRRIAQMSQRIDALNRERALARRVSEFVKEQDLFDEDDTRVSASRTEYGAAATSAPQVNAPNAAQTAQGSGRDGAAMGPGSNSGGAGGGAGGTPVGTQGGGGNGGSLSNNNPVSATLGGVASPADAPSGAEGPQGSRQTYTGTRPEELRVGEDATADSDSLEGLRAQRETLEREAKQLHEAASALEHNAAERR
jgi:predicted  nucleic acid-binding Zn-ribbon protein